MILVAAMGMADTSMSLLMSCICAQFENNVS